MRQRWFRLLIVGGIVFAAAGCATTEEWSIWRDHPTHFASSEHLVFSLRNREGLSPQVTRTDIAKARAQNWWGKAVTVAQEQILER